jgi:hypothetical protein
MNHPSSLLSKQTKAENNPTTIEKAMASSNAGSPSSSSPRGETEKDRFSLPEDDGDGEDEDESDAEIERKIPTQKRRSKKADEGPMSFPQKVRFNVKERLRVTRNYCDVEPVRCVVLFSPHYIFFI